MTAQLPPWLMPLYRRLDTALAAGQLPHALLIHGPGGWGEAALANALALRLIDRDVDGGRGAAEIAHPDLRWLVPEGAGEQVRIEAVRALVEFMLQTAQIAPRKVAVICDADAMNPYAANALLKILEEPPSGSHIVLVSKSLNSLLPTIRSRCQLLAVRPSEHAAALQWVRQQATDVDVARFDALAFEYGGAPFRLLDALGRDEQPLADALRDIARRTADPLTLAEAWAKRDVAELVERWMRYLPGVLGDGIDAARPLLPRRASAGPVWDFWQRLLRARGLLRGTTNPNPRLLLEALLLQWRDLAAVV
jgi:DNA polymerase III subunit delta'